MEIVHRISINGSADKEFFSEIKRLGIEFCNSPLPGDVIGLITFELKESDPRWKNIQRLIDLYGAFDIVGTTFSNEEILASDWNRLVPTYEWGYPQPENKMRWKQLTYNNLCSNCGAGYIQKAPFRLSREPKLGQHHFFTLFWGYTYFCRYEIISELEKNQILGFSVWNPMLKSSSQSSAIVTQLVFTQITNPGLADEDKKSPEKCPICGITKYIHHRKGKLHYREDAINAEVDFQQIYEWFGSRSHSGYREVIVSKRLSQLILSKGWKGVALKPIELV